jgi:hypothetical protein
VGIYEKKRRRRRKRGRKFGSRVLAPLLAAPGPLAGVHRQALAGAVALPRMA